MTTIYIHARDVGGIDDLELELEGRTVVVSGRNASNKTSLLQSIAFGLGATQVPIRSGADRARIEFGLDGRTVERVAERTGHGVRTTGEGIVSDDRALLLERFATLLETNALRTAVATGGDVETLLKEPMDIDSLERQQADLFQQRRELETDLETLSDVEETLSTRERELEEKRDRLEILEERLEELYDQQESAGTDDEVQRLRDRRAELRSEQDRLTSQLGDIDDAVTRLEDELDDVTDALRSAESAADEHDVESLQQERERIRAELDDVDERLEVLQSVLTANREMLDSDVVGALGAASGLIEDEVTCWACGREAPREAFDETIDRLAELVAADKQRKREREPEIDRLTERIEEARAARRRVSDLEGREADVERKLESRRDSRERKRAQLSELTAELEEIDADIAEAEAGQSSEQSTVAAEIEEVRVESRTLRRDVDRLEGVCADLRDQRAERDRKRSRVESLTEEIRELTARIENLEGELRETFNEAMDDLIDHLAFDRIDRVWLDGEFDLVIAREVDGTVRRDSLEHLAESEREMIGLVLGLAGFVAYDVAEVTPVLLLDSLGAFDADRAERLIEYFAARTDVLVVAVHPEMAAEFDIETVAFEAPTTS